jgi:hypothetical protein
MEGFGLDSYGWGKRPVGGCCEHGDEPEFMKLGEFLDKPRNS